MRLRWIAVACVAVTAAVYGRALGSGYLGDDFRFAELARSGLVPLGHALVGVAPPHFFRLASLVQWLPARLPHAAALMYGLALATHAANAALVARCARASSESGAGPLAAALGFAVFPILGEPVLWLSCAPDRIACLACLAFLCAMSERGGRGAVPWYALGLAAKEASLAVPLAAAALGWRGTRRTLGALAAVAAAYLAAHAAFTGLGGYEPIRLATTWERLRGAAIGVPMAVLAPLIGTTGAVRALECALSVALIAVVVWSAARARLLAALAAALLALIPALPILGLSAYHESGRFFYVPAALFFVGAGGALRLSTRPPKLAAGALIGFWAVAAFQNGTAWREASLCVERTLSSLQSLQHAYPAGALVLVDAPDSVRGAYAFRNGFPWAARVAVLRGDLDWRGGSLADLLPAERARLGTSAFVLAAGCDGSASAPGAARQAWACSGAGARAAGVLAGGGGSRCR